LSIFYWLLESDSLSWTLQWLFVFLPVVYIALCAYWSLFQLRIFNYYRLIPHHQSDANSLLFSAAYLSRLTAPMAYNFLLLINNEGSSFGEFMGQIKMAPILGKDYNLYFPIVLVVFSIANLFNLYTKFVRAFCIRRFQRFVFDEDFSDSQIERGRELVTHERELRERKLVSGAGNIPNVTSTKTSKLIKTSGKDGFPNFMKIFQRTSDTNHDDSKLELLKHSL